MPLLALSIVLCLVSIVSECNLTRSLTRLADHAACIKCRQKPGSIIEYGRITPLDQLLHDIHHEMTDLQMKERSVINHALDVICSIDQEQKFQSINPAAAKAWGYLPEELLGSKFIDLVIEEDRQKSLQSLFGAEKSIDTLSFENRLNRKNGSVLHVLWSAHWSAADRALFCVAHDITERKRAEKLLEESEQRIRQIFEDMPVGLIMANKLGIIEMCNPALNSMCQCEAAELIGKHLQVLLSDLMKTAVPPDYDKLFGALTDTIVRSKSGRSIPVNVTSRALTVGSEKKHLLVLVDTSERERLDQLKREFFAMVSHDLRSPLTSLLAVLDSLEEGRLGELSSKGKDMVNRNLHEVGRLIKLVDELMDIEKMKSGKFAIDAEMTPVNSIVEASIFAIENFAQRRTVDLEYEKSSAFVFADSSLLIRVLVNLLSNAIKFSTAGSAVEVAVKEEDRELLFSVRDSGCGIPDEFKERIFEQYEQVKPPDGFAAGGSGLGLPICKMIVEQHGGRIWVEDGPGSGSIFYFTIPVMIPDFEDDNNESVFAVHASQ